MILLTWLYIVQHSGLRGHVTSLSPPSYPAHITAYPSIYHGLNLHSISTPCHSCVLMQTFELKICVTHTESPFWAKLQYSSTNVILSWNSKSTGYASSCPISYPFSTITLLLSALTFSPLEVERSTVSNTASSQLSPRGPWKKLMGLLLLVQFNLQ